jgi:hypothetical protein
MDAMRELSADTPFRIRMAGKIPKTPACICILPDATACSILTVFTKPVTAIG